MAANLDGSLPKTLQELVKSSKLLVVGAGGIGCEILKNLVLSGFPDIEIIDLDTIDLSNLNRQFLFHREHVGQSKAEVARKSALQFNPDVIIKAYHDSITSTDYGVNFFKKFNVVLNALDNRAARNHVNRMCLNAEVPLIESGTAGYNGQVELIKKGLTPCYECMPKAAQKTFPGCTIRNTPSEPIHCIVWAKHLFNQLFGESIEDEDISPDVADPEAQNESGEGGKGGDEPNVTESGNIVRVNTRQWAKDIKYDAETLFNKFFFDDINYLLSMSNLWKTRKAPTPIRWNNEWVQSDGVNEKINQYHNIWSLAECGVVFGDCLKKLSELFEQLTDENASLVWDKDDQPAMNFVAACANVRAYIFQIAIKSRFEIKSMAGNIIPAIATTNAITAGVVVLQTFKVLKSELAQCKPVYMRLRLNPRNQFIVPDKILEPPNPNCYVCGSEPAIHVRIDTKKMTVRSFRDDILIKALNMVNPDVTEEAKGFVLISSEEGETECNEDKFLADLNIVDGVILKCDDFFQNYILQIIVIHIDAERDQPLFEVIANKEQLKPKEEIVTKSHSNGKNSTLTNDDIIDGDDGDDDNDDDGPSTSKKSRKTETRVIEDEDDDDLILVEEEDDDDEHLSAVSANDDTIIETIELTKDSAETKNSSGSETKNSSGSSGGTVIISDTTTEDGNNGVILIESSEGDNEDDDDDDDIEDITDVTDTQQPQRTCCKRKQQNVKIDTENDITEILDSDTSEETGPTKNKRTRRETLSEESNDVVININ